MSDVEWNEQAFERLMEDEHGPVGHALDQQALAVEAQAVENLSQAGTGRVYRRRGRVHQASAPGQPPATDTGLLRASVHTRSGRDSGGQYREVGTGQAVGVYLEKGTRRILPRPWLVPALDTQVRDF